MELADYATWASEYVRERGDKVFGDLEASPIIMVFSGGAGAPSRSLTKFRRRLYCATRIPSVVGATFTPFDLGTIALRTLLEYRTLNVLSKLGLLLEGTLQDLKRRYPGRKFILVGHSIGGVISATIAGRHKESVVGVVTLGSPMWGTRLLPGVLNELLFARHTRLGLAKIGEIPILSVRADYDVLVGENHSRLHHPMASHVVIKTDHLMLVSTEEVAKTVASFVTSLLV